MASREVRRNKQKISTENVTAAKKKWEKNPFLWIFSVTILIIIVVTFIGGPIVGSMGERDRLIFGIYNKKFIEYIPGNYLSQQKNIIAEQIRETGSSDDFQWQLYQTWKGAFDRTVIHTAILDETGRSGLYVTETMIDTEIVKNGPYTKNGTFNEQLYTETSNKEKSTTKNLMKEQLIHTQYLNDLFQSSRYTEREIDFIKGIGTPERDFYFIKYSFSDYPSKDVIAYGTKNIKLFRQIKLSRITIKSSKSDADRILQQLRTNETLFEELARSMSQDAFADKSGDMGWHQYFALKSYFDSTEDLDSIFLLKTGEMSNVISTASGWMIYRCDESASNPDLTNKEELKIIRSYIERFEKGKIEDYLVDKTDGVKLSAEKIGFEKACLKEGIEYNITGSFPIIFGNPSFNSSYGEMPLFKQIPIQGAASSEYFLKKLSLIKQGELSDAIILDNNVFILKLVDEKETDQKDMEITGFYYPYAVQTWQQEELANLIMNSDKLENNFNEVFSRYFLSE